MAALLVLAGGAAGCGDEESPEAAGDGQSKAAATPAGTTAAGDGDRTEVNQDRTDGALAAADGKVVRDWGPKRDREKVVAILAQMQRDFRAGRMAAVCAHVADHGLAQFQPGRTGLDTPCPAKLRAFAVELGHPDPSPRLRLLWVRAYPGSIASVWVKDERGKPIRVPFWGWDGDEWKLELGNFSRPETLNAELVGAAAYLSR